MLSNLNLNADEAKSYGVIEYIATSPEDLIDQINGTNVKNTTLILSGANIERFQPPLNLQFLKLLSDPTWPGF